MGNLINPISERIGKIKYWNSNWAHSNNSNYSLTAVQDSYVSSYVEKLFKICNRRLLRRKNTTLVSYQIIRQDDILNLVLSLKIGNILKLSKCVRMIIKKRRMVYSRNCITRSLLLSKYKNKINYNGTTSINKSGRTYVKRRRRAPLRFTYKLLAKTPYFNSRTITAVSHDVLVKNALLAETILTNTTNPSVNSTRRIKKSQLFKNSIFKFVITSTKLKAIKQFILFSLSKFVGSNNIKVLFNILGAHAINATFLAEYIVSRLKTNFPMRRLIKTTLKQMRKFVFKAHVKGFKIVCSGRFERRGRASYIWDTLGKVPNTNSQIKLDYITKLVTLTNSLCAVKIWIAYNTQPKKLLIL